MVKDQEEGQRISRRQVDFGISSIEEIKTKRQVEKAYNTELNQELNAQDTDWAKMHQELKQSGIIMNN